MKNALLVLGLLAILVGLAPTARANQLTYQFISPSFGGNPLNGAFLLNSAQAQGNGVNSGSSPNLSGLSTALSGLGSSLGTSGSSVATPIIIISPTTTGGTTVIPGGTTIP